VAAARPGASPPQPNSQQPGSRQAGSRQAGSRQAGSAQPSSPGATSTRPKPPSRSEHRNAAVRAQLKPLAPGERPWPVRIGALIALLVGGGDLIDVIVGGRITVGRTHAGVGGVVLFSAMMIVCAVGMWKMRYWAVLGFQAILAIVILIFSLLLIRASNLLGFLVATVIVFGGGLLFYKLVRTLSRIQMPKYPGP
jgi:hypothetical protein